MVQLGAFLDADIGAAIGEVRAGAEPDVVFDHGRPRAGLEHDQVARMEGDRLGPRRADVDHLDRQRHRDAAPDPQHQPVLHHRGVEREQGLAVARARAIAVAAQLGGERVRVVAQRVGQPAELDALGLVGEQRQALAQAAVDEDHPVADPGVGQQRRQLVQIDLGRGPGRHEADPLQRPQAGVFPGLDLRAGQAELGEARDAVLAQLPEPGQAGAGEGVAQGAELRDERLGRGGGRAFGHGLAQAAASANAA